MYEIKPRPVAVSILLIVFCGMDSKEQIYLYCSVFKHCQFAISCANQKEILLFAEIK